ncbi:MAG TPA: fluoride efflux transporter CrcB [Candidatus Limnocylindria bacterium]
MTLLLVGLGGFFGAIARYLVDGWIAERTGATFPFGTLVVNLSGAFVLGFLFALTVERGVLPSVIRPPVLIGFIGAYTTFSTLALESWRLIEDGSYALGLANLFGSMALGVVVVVVGLLLGRAVA